MYNGTMKKRSVAKEKKPTRAGRTVLRVLSTLFWLLTVAFIIYNGTSNAEQSSAQSSGVTAAVQAVAGFFAPDSWVASATGEALETLHSYVRTAAHFLEYCLLGALSVWCYLAWDTEKVGAIVPFCIAFYFPMVDEYLQGRTAGRAAEGSDILVDIAGGWTGCLFAFFVFWIIWLIVKKRNKRREYGREKSGNCPDKIQ